MNKGETSAMTKDSVRTREEELYYASCPICSTTLLQAETVINCIVKCEQCHQRISVDIVNGKVTVVLLSKKNN